MPDADALVELINVTKEYPMGGEVVPALRDVSLQLPKGAFVVVAGPSGSGKTTMLNLLGCLDFATSGKVVFGGRDVSGMGDAELSDFRARRLGFIFQSFNLIPVLSAYENVEYPLRLNHTGRGESRRRTLEMLEWVGLGGQMRRLPTALSGGQRQRVAIARALVSHPELVLADEPTANLDSVTGAMILDLMREMQERSGTTFVIATHDPMVTARAGLRIAMKDGRLEA